MPETSEPKKSQKIRFVAPFNEDDADVIIRSKDNLHFRVHKLFLMKASPVFEGMFSLPSGDESDPIQTVPFEEDGMTLSHLLRLCYPIAGPQLATLETISPLLDVCDKYQMYGIAEKLVSSELAKHTEENPLRAYILACRANSLPEAQRAAVACLSRPFEEIIASPDPDIRHLSALAFKSLLVYYNKCRQTAASVLSNCRFPWSTGVYCWFSAYGHDNICVEESYQRFWYGEGLRSTVYPRKWWFDLMNAAVNHLMHNAPPLSPNLVEVITFPKNLPCNYCRVSSGDDLHRFIRALEKEIEKQVRAVSGLTL